MNIKYSNRHYFLLKGAKYRCLLAPYLSQIQITYTGHVNLLEYNGGIGKVWDLGKGSIDSALDILSSSKRLI